MAITDKLATLPEGWFWETSLATDGGDMRVCVCARLDAERGVRELPYRFATARCQHADPEEHAVIQASRDVALRLREALDLVARIEAEEQVAKEKYAHLLT